MAEKKADKAADAGQAEMQKIADEASDQGFLGTKVDPIPNSEYSLQSGPDSPTALEQQEALKKARAENA